ncbi:hypothetical protein AB0J40_09760 [Amycolatopsis sp. NPDC049691]|uniref:hypothetical protein n=1 Tax=Amycolatopsis sp. NPDC049691 TaxID=3155155 RepID=UPI003435BFFD
MSDLDTSAPRPAAAVPARRGSGLLAAAIVVAGIGGGLLAWHPWDKPAAPAPAKDPQHITIQHVGDQSEPGQPESSRPVYCLTNDTGGLSCLVMPGRYTGIEEDHR